MSGFFGCVSRKDCVADVFYGTDYHSHLGTKRAGLAFYNRKYTAGYEFNCDFKDSILVDEETERQQDRADVAAGFMQAWEYRAKWYHEDEAAAKAMVAQEADVVEE